VASEEPSVRAAPGESGESCADAASGDACRRRLAPDPNRRTVLHGVIALGATVAIAAPRHAAQAQKAPADMRPQAGDVFVFLDGDKQGEEIKADDLEVGAKPVMAWPKDPKSGTVRDGSLLNMVLIVRLAPDTIEEDTKAHAADGIVAFSAICTHQQCPVTGWNADTKVFHCSCHQSEYDPREGGKKVAGPAPRGLPALPLKIDGGEVVAAGTFLGRVGAPVG
jgi:Rieske Fe-S protein